MARTEHVGTYQYLVLCYAAGEPVKGFTLRDLTNVVSRGIKPARALGVIVALIDRGMLVHSCNPGDVDLKPDCRLVVTDAGLDAKPNIAARKWLASRR